MKSADPGLPEVEDARKRLGGLKGRQRHGQMSLGFPILDGSEDRINDIPLEESLFGPLSEGHRGGRLACGMISGTRCRHLAATQERG